MRIRTAGDLVATFIAWLPLLAIVVFVGWFLSVSVMKLEVRTQGSEFFVSEAEITAPDHWKNAGQEQRDLAQLEQQAAAGTL